MTTLRTNKNLKVRVKIKDINGSYEGRMKKNQAVRSIISAMIRDEVEPRYKKGLESEFTIVIKINPKTRKVTLKK